MSYYLFKTPFITQDRLEIYFFFILNTISSKKFFFPSVIIDWNNLDKSIWNSKSFSIFLKSNLKITSSTYNCFNTKSIKYFTRLHLGLSHLLYHKSKHDFLDSINPICSCCFNIETTCHFLLLCPIFINERSLLLNDVSRLIKEKFPSFNNSVIKLLL